jgi:pimeloyl-ACP methyl ester carboxylesterase
MKKSLFVLIILLNTVCVMAQADYPAAVAKFQRYYNQKQADSIFNMYGPNMKAALPPDKTTAMVDQLHSQMGVLKSTTVLGDVKTYKAVFANVTLKMLLYLTEDNLLEGLRLVPYTEEAKDTDNVIVNGIHGTLTSPPGSKKVVLIIAGSGPVDRNGNIANNFNTNSSKLLAEALEKNGIACLRYDKRSIGRSDKTPEKDMTFERMVNDAAALIKMLKVNYKEVFVAGHSEGSLVGMIAAKENTAGFISIAGAGESADVILKKQLDDAAAAILLDSLKSGHRVQEPSGNLRLLFRSDVQPYMISWLKYDPQQEIKKLKIPVLIIQGTTDIQVSTYDAELLKKAKPDATLVEIEGMNHILKTAPEDRAANVATYNQPDLPIKPELTDAIVKFIHQK